MDGPRRKKGRFESLPLEITRTVYSFDPTFRELFEKVLLEVPSHSKERCCSRKEHHCYRRMRFKLHYASSRGRIGVVSSFVSCTNHAAECIRKGLMHLMEGAGIAPVTLISNEDSDRVIKELQRKHPRKVNERLEIDVVVLFEEIREHDHGIDVSVKLYFLCGVEVPVENGSLKIEYEDEDLESPRSMTFLFS